MAYSIPFSAPRASRSSLYRARRDFAITAADEFVLELTIYDSDTAVAPTDVTNATCTFTLMTDDGSCTALIQKVGDVVDGPNGRIDIEFDYAETAGLSGRYEYIVIVSQIADGQSCVIQGTTNIAAGEGGTFTGGISVPDWNYLRAGLHLGTFYMDGQDAKWGDGTSTPLDFYQIGTGAWRFRLGSDTQIFAFQNSDFSNILTLTPNANTANYMTMGSAPTTGRPSIGTAGTDANINLRISTKGTGLVQVDSPLEANYLFLNPGAIDWAGSGTIDQTKSPLFMSGVSHTGVNTGATNVYLNSLSLSGSDAIQRPTHLDKVIGLHYNHSITSGARGSRNSVVVDTSLLSNATNEPMAFLTCANWFMRVGAPMGGTGYDPITATGGAAFAINPMVIIQPGATFLGGVCVAEFDMVVQEPTGILKKWGVLSSSNETDVGEGIFSDASFISAASDNPSVGWRNQYQVGHAGSGWPVNVGSTHETSLFRAYRCQYTTGASDHEVTYGIKLLEADIAKEAFASQGFTVYGDGTTQIGRGVITANATGVTVNAAGRVATDTVFAPTAGGTGYSVNDILYLDDTAKGDYGGVYKATTVVAGVVTQLTTIRAPRTPGAPPGGAIATKTWGIHPGAAGCTITPTWTAGSVVQVGGVGNETLIGTGVELATNAATGHMLIPSCNGTPTGTVGTAGNGKVALILDRSTNTLFWSAGGGTWTAVV